VTLSSLQHFKKRLVDLLGYALIATVTLLVFDVLWGVFSRHVLHAQSSWTEELARFLLIWVVMLGGAAAFGASEHLGLDYFVEKMDRRTQRKMRYLVDCAALFFTIEILLIGGGTLTYDTFELGQMLMAMNIPKGYTYLAVPVSGVFFLIFALEDILETHAEVTERRMHKHEIEEKENL